MARHSFVCPICGLSLEQARAADQTQGISRQLASAESKLTHLQNVHPEFLAWERSKVKMIVLLGVAFAIPITAIAFWLALFVVHAPESASRSLALIPLLAFSAPALLFNKLGMRRYRKNWESRGGVALPSMDTSTPFPSQAAYPNEDQGILTALSDVSDKLGLPYRPASLVMWQTTIRQGKRGFQMVPPGQCLVQNDTIYFAENMKGRLSPEDWKPIMVSALIYPRLRGKLIEAILLRLIPILGVYVAAWIVLPSFFPTVTYYSPQGQPVSVNNNGWLILIFAGFAIMFLTIAIVIMSAGKIKLAADRKAADMIGKAAFLETLNKLRQASPSDVRSVERRIRNLNSQNL